MAATGRSWQSGRVLSDMATHVWCQSADADLFAPATVVHRARGRVDLKVKRYVGDVMSEQHIVLSDADFQELAPLLDLNEVALAAEGQLADAALMRAPTAPAVLHLLRRRFAHGRGLCWIGPYLCVQCNSTALNSSSSSKPQSEAEEDKFAWHSASLSESRPAPSVPIFGAYILHRMLSLGRSQGIALLGDGTCIESLGRMLRLVRRVQEMRGHSSGAELAETAEAGVLALHAFSSAAARVEDASGRVDGCAIWLRLRFDAAGRLVGGRLRSTLFHPARIAAGCAAGGGTIAADGGGVACLDVVRLLLTGASKSERKELRLGELRTLLSTMAAADKSASKSSEAAGIVDDAMAGIFKELAFRKLRERMMLAGVDGDDQKQIWRVLAALLHLASLPASSTTASTVEFCARLLGLSTDALTTWVSNDVGRKRIAFLSTAYTALFDWLVQRVDKSLQEGGTSDGLPPRASTTIPAAKPAAPQPRRPPPPPPPPPPPEEPANPFLAQMNSRASAKLKNRMSAGDEQAPTPPPPQQLPQQPEVPANGGVKKAIGGGSSVDESEAEPIRGLELSFVCCGGCTDSCGISGVGSLLGNYASDRLLLTVQRSTFIKLREAYRLDGLDASKLSMPDASDAVEAFEAMGGPLNALAEERLNGQPFTIAHFGEPFTYTPLDDKAAASAAADEWMWHHARPDGGLVRVLQSSSSTLLAEAAKQLRTSAEAAGSAAAAKTAAAAFTASALRAPSEGLKAFLRMVSCELPLFEVQPLVSLCVTKPHHHELRLRANKKTGRKEQRIDLVDIHDSRRVYTCIQRLGLVSLCSQASMPSIVFEQGELFRYVHPIKPPVTSMNREKVEAVLRRAGERFVEAKQPPSWLLGTQQGKIFVHDGAMLGLMRAVLAVKRPALIKLQAHARRRAALKRVTARREEAEAEQLEREIEAEVRRIVGERQPDALALLAPLIDAGTNNKKGDKKKSESSAASLEPTAERVESAFRQLERLAKKAMEPPPLPIVESPAAAPGTADAHANAPADDNESEIGPGDSISQRGAPKRTPRAKPLASEAAAPTREAEGDAAKDAEEDAAADTHDAAAGSVEEAAAAPAPEAAPAGARKVSFIGAVSTKSVREIDAELDAIAAKAASPRVGSPSASSRKGPKIGGLSKMKRMFSRSKK